jgi:excinuclease ABC subunit A
MHEIIIRGARVHNLDNIDIDIQRDKLVVITGLSGSGKSSLAFDTIYAEGQRRYVESLSAYARQFLAQMARPDVDIIEGLSPAIAIRQQSTARNPRSTVATITEIHDYLRLLYARVGQVFCYRCDRRIRAHTVAEIADHALGLPEGARYVIVAPVIRGKRGQLHKALERLRRDGYVRTTIDGEPVDLSAGVPALDKNKAHDVDVHVDRLVAKPGIERRLTDSIELALGLAEGLIRIAPVGAEPMTFSQRFACMHCDVTYPELEPRMFSFNSPHGACPACAGLGVEQRFDPDLVVPDARLSLAEGAIAPWKKRAVHQRILETVCQHSAIDVHTPWASLPQESRRLLLHGGDDEPISFTLHGRRYDKPFEGVLQSLGRRLGEAEKKRAEARNDDDADAIHDELRAYMTERPCRACQGARLRVESLHVRVAGRNLAELGAMPLDQARSFFSGLDQQLGGTERAIAGRLLREIRSRLDFLVDVGLSYLSLDRRAATLSGGESQRIRLATQIGASLVGVLYILDEPSIGLHPRDTGRLLKALLRLRDLGNTVIVVEHDADTMRAADQIIDMGPGAGVHGGRVVATGTVAEISACEQSLTGAYLAGKRAVALPETRRQAQKHLAIEGVRTHNLDSVSVAIPLGCMTCVTGVSGSGKSSLIVDTLLPAVRERLGAGRGPGEGAVFDQVRGIHHIDKIIAIDQSPIGRTPRSNPATYTGVLAQIREMFARLPESKARGYKAGRYSFNIKGGRCEACRGEGVLRIAMNFLPDVYVTCEACGGRRFGKGTLEIRYKGASIADVLDMSIECALAFWANVPAISVRLEAMRDVGLGYLTLGQAGSTLSGGEAQRLKLARELSRKSTGRTLYVLDEPTTGLHFEDIRQLLGVLDLLVEQGNTVVIIEHNLDVIKTADHIIDLGPEGGSGGGRIMGAGTPEAIARIEESHTGRFLRQILG